MSELLTLRMQLNTFFSGPQAWFFLAAERGYLRQEGLAIDFVEGGTAANTVPKMAAGGFDIGYGDINALIEHVGQGRPNAPLAVHASYNASPYTIAVAASGSLLTPRNLAGKRLLSHPKDAALLLFPEFCHLTGLRAADVAIEISSEPHSILVPRLLNGELDTGRFERGIELIARVKRLPHRPRVADLFDNRFLPAASERLRSLARPA